MRDKISINLLKKDSDGEYTVPLTAIETVEAISNQFTNGWINAPSRRKCKEFSGNEEQAAELVKQCEDQATSDYLFWLAYQ